MQPLPLATATTTATLLPLAAAAICTSHCRPNSSGKPWLVKRARATTTNSMKWLSQSMVII